MVNTGLNPQEIAEKVAKKELDLTKLPMKDDFEIKMAVNKVAKEMVERIKTNRGKREAYLEKFGDKQGPYLYVIVATGNIYEDITQAKAAAKQGADIIAVIRTTGQSLDVYKRQVFITLIALLYGAMVLNIFQHHPFYLVL